MLLRRYGFAPRTRLLERRGRWVLASDHPLREFTLNEAARRLVAVLDGETPLHRLVRDATPGVIGFLEDKVQSGLLTARYDVEPPRDWPQVEVIIPVYENLSGLRRCLEGVAAQGYPRDKFTVTVVDDASPSTLLEGLIGNDFDGLTTSWRHLGKNLGPGGARNAGAGLFQDLPPFPMTQGADAGATILAFLDSDCVPAPDWLQVLVSALDESGISAVGGAVGGLNPHTMLGGYEAECASLYMGEKGGPAGMPGGGVPYLPACNLLVWRHAFEQAGGFRFGMRVGEDVDFCWRLAAGGGRLFYLPQGVVRHHYRDRPVAFLRRKRDYATSEAALRRAHPERFRAAFPWIGAAVVGVLGVGLQISSPLLLALGLSIPLVYMLGRISRNGRALFSFQPWRIFLAWLRGALGVTLGEMRRLTRITFLFWLIPLAAWPRLIPLAALVFFLGATGEWLARRPRISRLQFIVGFAAECLAYSFGKVEGELKALARSFPRPGSGFNRE